MGYLRIDISTYNQRHIQSGTQSNVIAFKERFHRGTFGNTKNEALNYDGNKNTLSATNRTFNVGTRGEIKLGQPCDAEFPNSTTYTNPLIPHKVCLTK
jgi:hypothetical protein